MGSSIPGARANLTALLKTAFASQTDVQVYYGKRLSQFVAPKTVQILGWTGDQEPAELGPSYRREETFRIHMEIDCWAGGADPEAQAARETEVMDLFATISVLIANNYKLPSTNGGNDGVVRFAEVGTFVYEPETDNNGNSLGTLQFDVHCSQRITSLT